MSFGSCHSALAQHARCRHRHGWESFLLIHLHITSSLTLPSQVLVRRTPEAHPGAREPCGCLQVDHPEHWLGCDRKTQGRWEERLGLFFSAVKQRLHGACTHCTHAAGEPHTLTIPGNQHPGQTQKRRFPRFQKAPHYPLSAIIPSPARSSNICYLDVILPSF